MKGSKTLRQLKAELESLKNLRTAPEVFEAARKVAEARKPQIEALEKEIQALRSQRPGKAPRWPANTPDNVKAAADRRWHGTTEFHTYRIHMWNSKAFWTSYPSGGYSNNGGWNPTPACFELVSLIHQGGAVGRSTGKVLAERTGRVSNKVMRALLVEATGEEPHA